ncbi:MAG: TlpA family protein disulfide reductase [Verrucomicrobiaceae bacterium]|jgi:thiol-disulfide isomerase/thioredoxin|nr:TlpA family protein disulfide reductase [Verrucomicrobiaceae bacterium]
MKPPSTRALLLLALAAPLLPVHAQDKADPAEVRAAASASAKEMLKKLFSEENTAEQLAELAKEANKLGVPRQQIIEARLVWGLRRQDVDYLTKLLPEVEVLAANFDTEQAAALPTVEAVQSFAAYIRALKAGTEKNEAEFKKNILEAIWLSPQQANVFTQSIEKFRREAKMGSMVVDLKLPLTNSMGETTTLGEQLAGKKAILIDFWASWCGPCMQLMPALKKKGEHLKQYDIAVVAMNKDDENAESIAERIRKEQGMTMPWLVEPAARPYTKQFELDSIPRMVLISPEGKVLYNGHPQDPALWTALKQVNDKIEEAH